MEHRDPRGTTTITNHTKATKSMSETESPASPANSSHSPLRWHSPLSELPPKSPPNKSLAKSNSALDKYFSPLRPPPPPVKKFSPPETLNLPVKSASSALALNRPAREDLATTVTKAVPAAAAAGGGVDGGVEWKSRAVVSSTNRGSRKEVAVRRAALGLRVCEMALCLISFSVMAADRTQGWSGDSFDRYREYRYCVAVTIMGFVFSGFQAYDLAYNLVTGKHIFSHHLHYHFCFALDQILAYLLISASSSATTRVVDWMSNWGEDQFTEMATASISMSFLAFIAFSLSSLISGHNLCNRNIVA